MTCPSAATTRYCTVTAPDPPAASGVVSTFAGSTAGPPRSRRAPSGPDTTTASTAGVTASVNTSTTSAGGAGSTAPGAGDASDSSVWAAAGDAAPRKATTNESSDPRPIQLIGGRSTQ